MGRRVFITVADFSGDQHAAELIRKLRAIDPQIAIDGIGGPRMAEAGANILHESVGAAAMGWRGALRTFEVLRLLRRARRRYADPSERPDLHVCIDSSAMNLPFARVAKSSGVPVLYYIAPQLWASREGRMRKLRKYVDRVACILPFEEKYFREHGVDATFVGHPLFDELPPNRSVAPGPRFSAGDSVPPVIGIIPGSRRREVIDNFPHLLEVADRIQQEFPGTRFLIPTTEVADPIVQEMLAKRDSRQFEHTIDAFDQMMPRCDLCLCKSGTSTLRVAAYGVPMIVVYRINRLIWQAFGRWLVKSRKIALVNILANNTDLVPEFVPWYGSNEPVTECALDLLGHREKLEAQRKKLLDLVHTLDRPGASMNAARLALKMIDNSDESASGQTPVHGSRQHSHPETPAISTNLSFKSP